ncbi:MAG: hypothetical protein IPJ94_24575 [Chloroflexi bacterium]|nr:hypothetical protein [Chloroflexota bacterium]
MRTLQGGHDQPEIRWQRLGGKTPGQRIRKLPGMKRLLVWGGRFRLKRWDSGHRATFASFVQAVTGQGQPLVSGREAEQTVELINGMILSAFLERWVDFPLDAQEYPSFSMLCAEGTGRCRDGADPPGMGPLAARGARLAGWLATRRDSGAG